MTGPLILADSSNALFIALLIAIPFVAIVVAIARTNGAKVATKLAKNRNDFAVSHIFVSEINWNGVAIEADALRLLLVEHKEQRIVPATDIISVEILVDDVALVQTNRGSQVAGAAIGGLLLGPVGALLGGLSGSSRSVKRIKSLTLRIVTMNADCPNHDIQLFKSLLKKGDPKDSILLSEPLKNADAWHSRITMVMRRAAPAIPALPPPRGSIAEELRKLADLQRDGVLTEAEFHTEKQRLLSGHG